MVRPWITWLIYLLCLLIVIPAMAWLSISVVHLDSVEQNRQRQLEQLQEETELARQDAIYAGELVELEGRISTALWRLDTALTPLLAQEASRPLDEYMAFALSGGGKGKSGVRPIPGPLLEQPSSHIKLHFQIRDGKISSPQAPTDQVVNLAEKGGLATKDVPRDNILRSRKLLDTLKRDVDSSELVAMLPERDPRQGVFVATGGNSVWNTKFNMFMQGDLPQIVNADNGGKFLNEPEPQIVGPAQRGVPDQPVTNRLPSQESIQAPRQSTVPQSAQTTNAMRQQQAGQSAARLPAGQSRQLDSSQQKSVAGASQIQLNVQNPRFPNDLNQSQLLNPSYRGADWQRRNRAANYYAQSIQQQRVAAVPVEAGPAQAFWLQDRLILARRVFVADKLVAQGCWFDWSRLRAEMIQDVRDLLPGVDFRPIGNDQLVEPSRRLATLPIEILVATPVRETPSIGASKISVTALSPMRVSLIAAWLCLFLAAIAVAILLRGVIGLSERRGAFVSAVTHELRTPLTTFRMYAEMLSEGMVSDADKRQTYVETLRIEADRLSHLVENVLQYARLERGRPGGRREDVVVDELLRRVQSRLSDRAAQADMKLVIESSDACGEMIVSTDPAAFEQIAFNLVDNACKYAAAASDRRIHLKASADQQSVAVEVIDHGPGITPIEAKRLFRPFSKSVQTAANSAPGVGLGLALCRRLARQIGGKLEYLSSKSGARFRFSMPIASRL